MYITETNNRIERRYTKGGNGKYLIGLILLITLICLLSIRVSGSAVCESNCEQAEMFRRMAPQAVKSTLEGHLFSNSGIMLTASFENEYVTGFTILISNKDFGRLNDISKQVLCSELQKIMADTWRLCGTDSEENIKFSVVIN